MKKCYCNVCGNTIRDIELEFDDDDLYKKLDYNRFVFSLEGKGFASDKMHLCKKCLYKYLGKEINEDMNK